MQVSIGEMITLWLTAKGVIEDSQCAKALPMGETFCGKENKGGGRNFQEWAFDFIGVIPTKDMGQKLKRLYENGEGSDRLHDRFVGALIATDKTLITDGFKVRNALYEKWA